jgi:two-component system sensor histidine kinase DegS
MSTGVRRVTAQASFVRLDEILLNTVTAIKDSQQQINSIANDARSEVARLTRELENVKERTLAMIEKVDAARREEQQSRLHLMKVSQDLKHYDEEAIKLAYARARDMQVRLIVYTEQEKELRTKRDELQRTLKNVTCLMVRAEALTAQVGVALDYLSGNIDELSRTLGSLQEKRGVAIRIIQAQEKERRRVARDLHDGLAQQLAGAILGLEVVQKILDSDTDRARLELNNVKQIVRSGLREARDVIFNLRPLAVGDIGLEAAVNKLIGQMVEQNDVNIFLSVHGEEQPIDNTALTSVFRIIQEALNNVIKHADATEIKVRLEFAPKFLAVQVQDNGCGFEVPPENIRVSSDGHLGLVGMRERAELIGARLTIDSKPNEGTRIFLHLPRTS